MSPFEGLNESNNSPIYQETERYRNEVSEKLNAVGRELDSQRNESAITAFKEIKETIIKNNENALSAFEKSMKTSQALNTPRLKERSISEAKAEYEIINSANLTILASFLNRFNISSI